MFQPLFEIDEPVKGPRFLDLDPSPDAESKAQNEGGDNVGDVH